MSIIRVLTSQGRNLVVSDGRFVTVRHYPCGHEERLLVPPDPPIVRSFMQRLALQDCPACHPDLKED